MNNKNYLWILPFLSFIAGYQVLNFVYTVNEIQTPSLVGQPLLEAVKILSDYNLNARILAQKEEPDLPEGTILSQSPAPQQKIKPHQHVFLVLAKTPPKIPAPSLLNKTENEIARLLSQKSISNKSYYLTSQHPNGSCIAQIPQTGTPLETKKMTTYFSKGANTLKIMPNFKGKNAHIVFDFLKSNNINSKLFHASSVGSSHRCDNCIIVDQKPLPGSLVDLGKPTSIQLQAE